MRARFKEDQQTKWKSPKELPNRLTSTNSKGNFIENNASENHQLPPLSHERNSKQVVNFDFNQSLESSKNDHTKTGKTILPPINARSSLSSQRFRNRRGITTTASPHPINNQIQTGLEAGDICRRSSSDATITHENIQQIERNNIALEQQLFSAYDRIISAIQKSDAAYSQALNVSGSKSIPGKKSISRKDLRSVEARACVFSKESLTKVDRDQDKRPKPPATPQSKTMEELVEETEELAEIEQFLTKYPFERLRDDETLITYDEPEDDSMTECASPRARKCISHADTLTHLKSRKGMTPEQEEIQRFYQKILHRQPTGIPSQSGGPKELPQCIGQDTKASRLKKIPSFRDVRPKPVTIQEASLPAKSASKEVTVSRANKTAIIRKTKNIPFKNFEKGPIDSKETGTKPSNNDALPKSESTASRPDRNSSGRQNFRNKLPNPCEPISQLMEHFTVDFLDGNAHWSDYT